MSKKKKSRITTENIYRPKKFSLRNYNRFVSQFIQKDNYGWYNNGQRQKFRYKAEQIRLWRQSKNRYDWTKAFLKEKDKITEFEEIYERINDSFESHLYKKDGYIYYTSSIYTDVAMFCLDIDSHQEQDLESSISASHYIIDTFFPGAYFDISTHGAGIHIYVFIDFTGFPHYSPYDLEIRNRQFSAYLDNLRPIIKSRYNVDLDKPKGTYPHDYNLTNRGVLCKLPLPKTQEQFSHLVDSPIFTFEDLCSTDETVKQLINDIMALEQQETEEIEEITTESSTHCAGPYTSNLLGQESLFLNQKDRLEMRSPDAIVRARASMRILFRELGRRPTYEEWNTYYENNGLNTGKETERRRPRYEEAADYTENTFNEKYTQPPYQFGEFIEDLKNAISKVEMNRTAKTVNFSGKMKYQDLDVVMGEHMICMYKNNKAGLEFTVPTKGIRELFAKLTEDKKYIRACNNDRIRGARAVLKHIGWITLLDPNTDFGVSQKWGVGENCPRYGDFLTFVDMDKVNKVIENSRPEKTVKLT